MVVLISCGDSALVRWFCSDAFALPSCGGTYLMYGFTLRTISPHGDWFSSNALVFHSCASCLLLRWFSFPITLITFPHENSVGN